MISSDLYCLTYLTPFIGGFLADRVLGYVKSIYLGGILMAAGYIGMGIFKDLPLFLYFFRINYCGNGFFKPTISTLLGNLYSDEKYKANKDSGYNIFSTWELISVLSSVTLLQHLCVINSVGEKHLSPQESGCFWFSSFTLGMKITDKLLK